MNPITLITLSIIMIAALVIAFRIDFIGKTRTGYRNAEQEATRHTPTRKY